ncbi:hypothetical protein BSKO_01724 [Bryopsis sp. KO-2023]|nr:hypothetical protein BSKO_01724 [Bryopsis sp. KO-2023]
MRPAGEGAANSIQKRVRWWSAFVSSRESLVPPVTYSGNRKVTRTRAHVVSEKRTGERRKKRKQGWRVAPKNARLAAVDQLLKIEEEGAFIGLIDSGNTPEADKSGKDDEKMAALRDVRFSRALVAGVTKWQRNLDAILSKVSKTPLHKLDSEMHQILRIGAYELVHLNSPSHVVNELVDTAKVAVNPALGGFANGVLRNLARRRDAGENLFPKADFGDLDSIARLHSHPTWMVERWVEQFGREDTIRLLEWNNRAPHYGLRMTPRLGSSQAEFVADLESSGVEVQKSTYLPDQFLHVKSGMQSIKRSAAMRQGTCVAQDEAAGLVVELLNPRSGDTVLDGCAAPGGKTLFAAEKMKGQGEIVALDVKAGRLEAMAGAVRLQGFDHMVQLIPSDLRDYARNSDGKQFDCVLVDAPCSGSGVLARRADMRWRRGPGDVEELKLLQTELIEAGAKLVKPGGVLVYSTCSIEKDENEDRIQSFLDKHLEFSVDTTTILPATVTTRAGFLRTLPFQHGIDGAFGARLRREH